VFAIAATNEWDIWTSGKRRQSRSQVTLGQVSSCNRAASSNTISSRRVATKSLILQIPQDSADHLTDRADMLSERLLREPHHLTASTGIGHGPVQQVTNHVLPQRRQRRAGQRADIGGRAFGKVMQQHIRQTNISSR
jgi:hypothetical protein